MASKVEIKVRLTWWFRPYVALTRLGLLLRLPINPDVVVNDLKRCIVIETKVVG